MTLESRIADCQSALETCRTNADLRDVWAKVWRHWSGAVPNEVTQTKERLKNQLTPKRAA